MAEYCAAYREESGLMLLAAKIRDVDLRTAIFLTGLYCKVSPRASPKISSSLCFGLMSRVTLEPDHVWETELPEKLLCIQVNDERAKYLSNCRNANGVASQLFSLIMEQEKSGLTL